MGWLITAVITGLGAAALVWWRSNQADKDKLDLAGMKGKEKSDADATLTEAALIETKERQASESPKIDPYNF